MMFCRVSSFLNYNYFLAVGKNRNRLPEGSPTYTSIRSIRVFQNYYLPVYVPAAIKNQIKMWYCTLKRWRKKLEKNRTCRFFVPHQRINSTHCPVFSSSPSLAEFQVRTPVIPGRDDDLAGVHAGWRTFLRALTRMYSYSTFIAVNAPFNVEQWNVSSLRFC